MNFKQFYDSLDGLDKAFVKTQGAILDATAPIRSIGKLMDKERSKLIKEINETPDFKLAVFCSPYICAELDGQFNETEMAYRSFLINYFYPHKPLKSAMRTLDGEGLSFVTEYMLKYSFDEKKGDLDEQRWNKIEANLSQAFSECLRESFYKFNEKFFDIVRRKFVNEKALYRGGCNGAFEGGSRVV